MVRARVGYIGPDRPDTACGGQGSNAIEHGPSLAAAQTLRRAAARCLEVRSAAPLHRLHHRASSEKALEGCRPGTSVRWIAHARRPLDDRPLPSGRGCTARRGARGERGDGLGPDSARLHRRGRGARVPRRRAAAARPAAARRHGRRRRADPRRNRGRHPHLRARGLRRRRHLRHCAGGAHAALARRRRRVAPAEPLRGGLRRLARDPRTTGRRRLRPRAHGGLRHHGRRGGRRGDGARVGRDRDRPPPAGRGATRLSGGRDEAVVVPVSGALRHRRRVEARRGARRRRPAAPRPRGAGDDRGRRSARRREPGLAARRPAGAGADDQARATGADAEREGRSRRRSTPPRSASAWPRG